MILFIEPISSNVGMYVPAYPLPLVEIAGFVHAYLPRLDIRIVSVPMDYGLPLTRAGKERVYENLMQDLVELKPEAIGISCTALAQAAETISLCERIKRRLPETLIFLGGYFPTFYHEELLSATSAVDFIVIGEGERPVLEILHSMAEGKDPRNRQVSNLVWRKDGRSIFTRQSGRFDPKQKAPLNLDLLRHPEAYPILPYAFSRGCPHRCRFCMEPRIRPQRLQTPSCIVWRDLSNLLHTCRSRTLLVSDALFQSFHIIPHLQSLGMKINFETRCDVLDPAIIPDIVDVCGLLALGFESASYRTLRRMNKVKDRAHYERYIQNTEAIVKTAAAYDIPLVIFMIVGFPGDTLKDLENSLAFARSLSGDCGGGLVFKAGECHVYPKTRLHRYAVQMPDVVFDDDGVFGQNTVRQSSAGVTFNTISQYASSLFELSRFTPKLQETVGKMMPFFRMPAEALRASEIPEICFLDEGRSIFCVQKHSLDAFRGSIPDLMKKYRKKMAAQRNTRRLALDL